MRFEVLIDINDLKIIAGNIPSRALGLVIEWANQHKEELQNNWNRASQLETIKKIDPLA